MNTTRPLAALFAVGLALSACQSTPPLTPDTVGQVPLDQLRLPPGLQTPFKAEQAVALAAPIALLSSPTPSGSILYRLPAGSVVTLKSRVLNTVGPWWLVETSTAGGWLRETDLPAPKP